MPYVKNGVQIEDVSSASQGEASFFNMAISSALRAMSMTRYNIGLFDEVDSMFDEMNRQRFIPVLEKQLELNNIHQAFVITHNQMFKQYPVDTINMEELELSSITAEYS
jgi:DNA repair exonuclease SbcCD ATPase subunit